MSILVFHFLSLRSLRAIAVALVIFETGATHATLTSSFEAPQAEPFSHRLRRDVLLQLRPLIGAPEPSFTSVVFVFLVSVHACNAQNLAIVFPVSSMSALSILPRHIVCHIPIYLSHLSISSPFYYVPTSSPSLSSPVAAFCRLFAMPPVILRLQLHHHLHCRATFYAVLLSLSPELRHNTIAVVAELALLP